MGERIPTANEMYFPELTADGTQIAAGGCSATGRRARHIMAPFDCEHTSVRPGAYPSHD
jgi:hypothetical protein